MLRATFFATGLFIGLVGVSLLFVKRVEVAWKDDPKPEPGFRGLFTRMSNTVATPPRKTITPPDWAAFSMMSIGAVTMLYSIALPKKKKE